MKTNKTIDILERVCLLLITLMPIAIACGRGVADTVLSLTAILFISITFITRNLAIFKHQWLKAALILWGYFVINSFFHHTILTSLAKTLPFIRFIIFAACFQEIANKFPQIHKRILISLIASVSFLVLDGYIQLITGIDILGKPKSFENMGTYTYYRLTGPFSKLVLGATIAMLISPIVATVLYKFRQNFKSNWWLFLPIILSYILIFATGERSATVQVVIGAVFLFTWFYHTEIFKIKMLLSIMGALVIIGAAIYFFTPESMINRHLASLSIIKEGSNSAYGALWQAAIDISKDNFVFGIGANNYDEACRKISPLKHLCSYHPHNIYLELIVEFGIVGLTLFFVFLYCLFKEMMQIIKQNSATPFFYALILGATTTIFTKLLPFLPTSGFFKNWYAVPLWFNIGWLLAFLSTIKTSHKS